MAGLVQRAREGFTLESETLAVQSWKAKFSWSTGLDGWASDSLSPLESLGFFLSICSLHVSLLPGCQISYLTVPAPGPPRERKQKVLILLKAGTRPGSTLFRLSH